MSELNDLLTTRELQRWRLILGEAAETTLCGLDDNARQIDHALEWLYGRDPERLQRGERSGGLGSHRRNRCLVTGNGYSGAGANRPAVLYRHRFAVGDLAGEKSASGENYSSTA